MRRNRNDGDTAPLTLGQALAAQVRLIVWCKACGHRAEPDVPEQVAHHGAGMTVIDWAARLRCQAAVKIFLPSGASEPVYAPYTKHYPPDTKAALRWLMNRQPALWRDRREVNMTDSLEHRLGQMTPEERIRDVHELAERARRRIAEYRLTIEHHGEPEPAPESPAEPESQD